MIFCDYAFIGDKPEKNLGKKKLLFAIIWNIGLSLENLEIIGLI